MSGKTAKAPPGGTTPPPSPQAGAPTIGPTESIEETLNRQLLEATETGDYEKAEKIAKVIAALKPENGHEEEHKTEKQKPPKPFFWDVPWQKWSFRIAYGLTTVAILLDVFVSGDWFGLTFAAVGLALIPTSIRLIAQRKSLSDLQKLGLWVRLGLWVIVMVASRVPALALIAFIGGLIAKPVAFSIHDEWKEARKFARNAINWLNEE